MASPLIKNTSASYQSIRENVTAYLEGLSNYEEIKDQLPASNMTLIENLIAGFGSYIAQRQALYREETYLSKAKLASSVYEIANTFGYSINRYKAPSVKLRYNAIPTISVKSGDILGSYGDKDLVYFGPNKILEKLDTLDVVIGTYQEIETNVAFSDGVFLLDISPEVEASIDRDNISCFLNNVRHDISPAIEDYIVFGSIADYSQDPFSTRLFVSDQDSSYGIVAAEGAPFTVKYIETDGEIVNLRLRDLTVNEEYLAVEVNHIGSNGDSLAKIKQLAPLLYSTLRRMVTEKDHSYITQAHPFIQSAAAERDLGVPYKVTVHPDGDPETDTFTFDVNGVTISYDGAPTNTLEDVAQALFGLLHDEDPFYVASISGEVITIVSKDSRNETFQVTSGSNTVLTLVDENEKPACCTINIFYVAAQTEDEPYFLTDSEQNQLALYLERFKMVGTRLILNPATKDAHNLSLRIQLTDSDLYEETKDAIEALARSYELKLDQGFDYGKFLVQVSRVTTVNGSGSVLTPVTSVVPNQQTFNIEPSKYQYIKFDSIEILLE